MTFNHERGYEDIFPSGKLKLATFGLGNLRGKSCKNLKFLCEIWGMEEVFERFYITSKKCSQVNKNEIVVRLRALMRQEENKRRTYRRRFPIITPESIRAS